MHIGRDIYNHSIIVKQIKVFFNLLKFNSYKLPNWFSFLNNAHANLPLVSN